MMRRWLMFACVLARLGSVCHGAEARRLKVAILDGQNNHDWRSTTPVLREAMAREGRCAVTVLTAPPVDAPAEAWARFRPDYRAFDGVVTNFTDFGVKPCPPQLPDALTEYVREGGALVVVHAATSGMYYHTEYARLVGMGWRTAEQGDRLYLDEQGRTVRQKKGEGPGTAHGRPFEWVVTIWEGDHPVCAGLPRQWKHVTDELWAAPRGPAEGVRILATAVAPETKQNEPVVWTVSYGKGRVFVTMLGHDAEAMRCVGFQTLLRRGFEWAATGKAMEGVPANFPTADRTSVADAGNVKELLNRAKTWHEGESRKDLSSLEEAIREMGADARRQAELEPELLTALQGDGTLEGKQFICQQLWVLGTGRAVQALAKLLEDESTADLARFAIRTNPAPAVNEALRNSAGRAKGKRLVGLVNTLGERQDAGAVEMLGQLARGEDEAARIAAISALGSIGTAAAAKEIEKAASNGDAAVADALIRCAGWMAQGAEKEQAAALYERICGEDRWGMQVRMAALRGLAHIAPQRAVDKVAAVIREGDAPSLLAVAGLARTLPGDPITSAILSRMEQMPAGALAAYAEALGARQDARAVPVLETLAGSADAVVRKAAIRAMGAFPADARAVANLARLAGGVGVDRDSSLLMLGRMSGEGVDRLLVERAQNGAVGERIGALRGMAVRQSGGAAAVMIELARAKEPAIAAAAIEGLGEVAGEADFVAVVALVTGMDGQPAAQRAALAVARRMSRESAVAKLAQGYGQAPENRKVAMLRMLGALGGADALKVVRSATRDPSADVREAAIRAMAEWPDAAAAEDLAALAKEAQTPTQRGLALRGYLRLVQAADVAPAEKAKMLERVRGLASTPAEKRLLLSSVAASADAAFLRIAESHLGDAAVQREAEQAVLALSEKLVQREPEAVRSAIRRVIATSRDESTIAQAKALVQKSANIAGLGRASSPDGLEKDGQAGGDQAAIDGKLETYWDEVDGKGEYRLIVSYGRPRNFCAVSIVGYRHQEYAPKDFEVKVDGRVVKVVKNAAYADNALWVAFPPVSGKDLELRITGSYGPSPAIRELGIYEPAE